MIGAHVSCVPKSQFHRCEKSAPICNYENTQNIGLVAITMQISQETLAVTWFIVSNYPLLSLQCAPMYFKYMYILKGHLIISLRLIVVDGRMVWLEWERNNQYCTCFISNGSARSSKRFLSKMTLDKNSLGLMMPHETYLHLLSTITQYRRVLLFRELIVRNHSRRLVLDLWFLLCLLVGLVGVRSHNCGTNQLIVMLSLDSGQSMINARCWYF